MSAEALGGRVGAPSDGRPARCRAVILSPHFDDAVFSCGGTMGALRAEGRVVVINVFGGSGTGKRSAEEARAAGLLGFESEALAFADAPKRRMIHRSVVTLHLPPMRPDAALIPSIAEALRSRIAALEPGRVYAPLGFGGHVDHVLTREAALRVVPPDLLHLYEDAPYCLSETSGRSGLTDSFRVLLAIARGLNPGAFRFDGGARPLRAVLSDVGDTIALKIAGIEAYASQARQFFRAGEGIRVALAAHSRAISGGSLEWAERYWSPA